MTFINNNNFLDFHTHSIKRSDNNKITEIVSIHLGKEKTCNYFTIGKHPWWSDRLLTENEKIKLEFLVKSDKCLAIGEIGLDKLKGVNLDIQEKILNELLEFATQNNKPVVIHCVRAFDRLIKIKRKHPKLKNWCIHGFSRHKELAKQLIKEGFYISIMPVKQITKKYIELIKFLPVEKFFLETDSMPNTNIETIYKDVAKIKNISVDELIKQINNNSEIFFTNKKG